MRSSTVDHPFEQNDQWARRNNWLCGLVENLERDGIVEIEDRDKETIGRLKR